MRARPAKPLTAAQPAVTCDASLTSNGQLVAETLMWPLDVIVRDIFGNQHAQMSLAKRHHMIQTLGLDRQNEATRELFQTAEPKGRDS